MAWRYRYLGLTLLLLAHATSSHGQPVPDDDPSEQPFPDYTIEDLPTAKLKDVLAESDEILGPTRDLLMTLNEAKSHVDGRSYIQCLVDLIPMPNFSSDPSRPNYKEMSSQQLAKELATIRYKFRNEIQGTYSSGMGQLAEEDQLPYLRSALDKAEKRIKDLRKNLLQEVYAELSNDDRQACRSEGVVYGSGKGKLDVAYIELTTLAELYSAFLGPTFIEFPFNTGAPNPRDRWNRTETNYIAVVMGDLADRIANLQPGRRYISPVPLEVREVILEAERKFAIREFEFAAAHARIFDPASRRPMIGQSRVDLAKPKTGEFRRQLEWAIRKNLIDYINARAEDASPILQMFSFQLMMDPTDERALLAQKLDQEIESNLDLGRAMLLNIGRDPTPREFFLASANALRRHNDEVVTKFRNEYLNADDGPFFLDTGLGTRFRMLNATLDDAESLREVSKRLDTLIADTDHVVAVFEEAAKLAKKGGPEGLSPEDLKLMDSFGYIATYFDEESGKDKKAFTIPTTTRSLSHWGARQEKDLALPGAALLDAFTPKSVAMMYAGMVLPQAGGKWLSAGLEGLTTTELQLLLARSIVQGGVDFTWSAATEAGENYLKGEKKPLQWERNFLNSFFLGPIQSVAGSRTKDHLDYQARQLSRTTTNPRLRNYLNEVFKRAGPTGYEKFNASKHVYETITDSLTLLQDTSISFTYQSLIEGQEIDSTAFLEMLLQGALAQAISRAGAVTSDYLASSRVPKHLRDAMASDPKFHKEMVEAIELLRTEKKELFRRYADVVENTGDAPETRFKENMAGKFTWVETKALYAGGKISQEAMTEIGKLRKEFNKNLYFIAQIDATKEIEKNFGKYLEHARTITSTENEAQELALARYRKEIAAVNAEPKDFGSETLTSDKDRSTGSIYLRKHLVAAWDAHAGNDNEGALPTSARAFDMNEYIDVFSFIKDNRGFVEDLRNKTPDISEEHIISSIGAGMPHQQKMLAIAMSGGMRSMDEARMEVHIGNLRKGVILQVQNGEAPDTALSDFNKRAEFAKQHLLASRAKIDGYALEFARGGGDPNDPDTQLRAKDKLYQERFEKINELQWELAHLEENGKARSDEALTKRAEIEQRMSIAMRDGIETYTNTVGLDIVVNLVQSRTKTIINEDGVQEEVKMSVADRLEDPDFTLKGNLANYDSLEIQGIVHDQIMFIAEHCHAFSHGIENEYATGRALGKYLERYFLAEKIMGLDISEVRKLPESDPTRRLLEIAQKLSAKKNEPDELLKILQDSARKTVATPRDGLAEVFYLIEQVVPGMDSMTGVSIPHDGSEPFLDKVETLGKLGNEAVKQLLAGALARERQQQDVVLTVTGAPGAAEVLSDQLEALERERIFEEESLKELQEAAKELHLKDWKRINQLALELEGLDAILANLPWQVNASKTYSDFRAERNRVEKALEAAKSYVRDVDLDAFLTDHPEMNEYRRIKNRLLWLGEKYTYLGERLKKAQERVDFENQLDGLNLSGKFACGTDAQPIGDLVVQHGQDKFNMSMTLSDNEGGEPDILFDASYSRGVVLGRWWNPSVPAEKLYDFLPPVFAGMPFKAETNETGDTITFTHAPAHKDIKIVWDKLACRKGLGDAPPSEQKFVSISMGGSVTGIDQYREDENTGYFKAIVVTPDGDTIDPYNGADLYAPGSRMGSGMGWHSPGAYRLAVKVSDVIENLNVTIVKDKLTQATIRPGQVVLNEVSADGPVNSRFDIFDTRDPTTAIYTDVGGAEKILLPPGRYNVVLIHNGAIEKENVLIQTGVKTELDVEWAMADIEMKSGEQFFISGLSLLTASGESSGFGAHTSVDVYTPSQKKRLRMPPGRYVIEISSGGETASKTVTLTGNAVERVEF